MNLSSRVSAILTYVLPVIGWLYVYFFKREDEFAVFHLKQSIGLIIFLIGTFLLWAITAWILALVPYMAVFSVALFTMVIVAYIFGFIVWVTGILHVLRNQMIPLTGIGNRANRLPIV
jgi:uncharacterized membrane protein